MIKNKKLIFFFIIISLLAIYNIIYNNSKKENNNIVENNLKQKNFHSNNIDIENTQNEIFENNNIENLVPNTENNNIVYKKENNTIIEKTDKNNRINNENTEEIKNILNKENEKNSISDKNNQIIIEENNNKLEEKTSYPWQEIDEIATFADKYYNENYSKTRLISKNGRLYNKASETYIDINFLIEKGLDKKYKNYPCEILLVKPNDLREFKELSIKNSEDGLTIFIAKKELDKQKYLIASSNSAGGIISEDEYNKFIYKYSEKYGTPTNVIPNTEKYNDILGFIKLYEGIYSDYFVRNIVADNKYACVILSPISNMNDIRQYILIKENNFWKVVLSGLENISRVPIYVNEHFPNLNIDILPKYEISNFNINNFDYTQIYNTLINNNYINNAGDISYISGAGKYCYAKDYNNNYYLLIKQNDIWKIFTPSGYSEAYNIMINIDDAAPTFILLYE